MNVKDEIKELKQRISELEEQVKKEDGFPQEGEQLFFVSTFGVVLEANFTGGASDKDLIEIGNVFKTKEQAEFAVEKLKVEAELRKFSRTFYLGRKKLVFKRGKRQIYYNCIRLLCHPSRDSLF